MRKLSSYQEAALLWLEEHPGQTLADCKSKEKVVLASLKEVELGSYIRRIRGIYRAMKKGKKFGSCKSLTSEEIEWWSSLGLVWEPLQQRYYRYQVAALLWLQKNPGLTLNDCFPGEKVVLDTGKEVELGNYLKRIRYIYKAMKQGKKFGACRTLTSEEINWWENHGICWEKGFETKRTDYRGAARVWIRTHPGKSIRYCPADEKVVLDTGEVVALGSYLKRITYIYRAMQEGERYGKYRNLTIEEIEWWKSHGFCFEDPAVVSKETILSELQNQLMLVSEDWVVELFIIIVKRCDKKGVCNETVYMEVLEKISAEYLLTLAEKRLLYEYLEKYFWRIQKNHALEIKKGVVNKKKIKSKNLVY